MFARLMLGLLLLLACSTTRAGVEPSYVDIEQRLSAEQLHATGLDTLSPSQLQALNKVLREQSAEIAKSQPMQDTERPDHAWNVGLDEQAIKSRLKGSIDGWEPGTVFELDNGQHWKVLKGSMKLRKPLQSPEIEVVPGMAGRWFLHVSEDLPGARVYRLD